MALFATSKAFGEDGVPGGYTVTVVRRRLKPRPGSGEPALGPWSEADSHSVDNVGLDRSTSSDVDNGNGDSFLQRAKVFAPADADIEQGDRIVFPFGTEVTVDGIPDRSRSMFTRWRPPMSVDVMVTHG